MKLTYIVKENEYLNVKEVLKVEFELSERLISTLKHKQFIFLNSKKAFVSDLVKPNDKIEIYMNFEEESENIIPTNMNLNILYEDEALLILNKPANLAIHPSITHYTDSLSNGVKYYFDQKNLKIKIRPVNRLDKDTSGIVIFAKHAYIQECLIRQMKNKKFQKKYLGLVSGTFNPESGIISAPITRKENSIIERTVNLDSKLEKEQAITHYKTLKTFNYYSLVEFTLETGRTHQIRVHCKYKGHPLIGDSLYGMSSMIFLPSKNVISRQALHAYKISFYHPLTKEFLEIEAKPPEDFFNFLETPTCFDEVFQKAERRTYGKNN